jgi:hypothetical protein
MPLSTQKEKRATMQDPFLVYSSFKNKKMIQCKTQQESVSQKPEA